MPPQSESTTQISLSTVRASRVHPKADNRMRVSKLFWRAVAVGGFAASAAYSAFLDSWLICVLSCILAVGWFSVLVLEFIVWRDDRKLH